MVVCGYTDLMGTGVEILFEGMYDAIFRKVEAEGLSFGDILRRELIEIPRINAALLGSDESVLKMFCGLNQMAMALFSKILESPTSESCSKDDFMREVRQFITVLREAEDYNLQIPTASPGTEAAVAKRASLIGNWIAQTYSSKVAS